MMAKMIAKANRKVEPSVVDELLRLAEDMRLSTSTIQQIGEL
jgi:hypothetical protein